MISLISKNVAQNNIKDYRPITCCSTLNKIISKIIAIRFEKVMATTLCEAQSGFDSGRKILDIIILAN